MDKILALGRLSSSGLYVALFPAMFFYHLLAAIGLFPLFLGGWWGAVIVAGAALTAPLVFAIAVRTGGLLKLWPLVALVIIVACVAAYNFQFGQEWQQSTDLLKESFLLLCGWATLFGVGFFFRATPNFINSMMICLTAMAAVSVLAMDPKSFSFVAVSRFNAPKVADYQWFATAYVFVAMFCLSVARGRWQVAILATSIAVLFLLSSRSELYAFVFVAAAWAGLKLQRREFVDVMLTPVAVLAAFAVIFIVSIILPDVAVASSGASDGNFRQAEVLDLAKSQSFIDRLAYLQKGWADILASPIFGVYGGQTQDGAQFGTYIHNGLEVWRQYGLVAFVLFAWMVVSSASQSLRHAVASKGADQRWVFALYICVFCSVLIVLTKSPFWPLPALAWGLVAGLQLGSAVPFRAADSTAETIISKAT